jgi:preprotein translocase subunit Sec61beta
LNVPDYRAFYENKEKLAKPVEGSLQWLVSKDSQRPQGEDSLQYEDFSTWRDSSTPSCLLILGPPGLGKSVLSNFVVNHIQQFVKNQRNKVIFFFCNIKDGNARTASSVLRALIVQLCTDKRYFQKLPNRFQAKGDSKAFHSATFDELWRPFDDLVQSGLHSRIFCIIDGLDVYETVGMEDLVTKLGEMAGRRPIWLFLTSRPDGPVGNRPSGTRRNLRQPNHDVQVFITKQLELLPSSFNRFHTDIREGILSRAGGTFLWIHIILKEIRKIDFPSKKSVQQVIKKTPRELDELYTDLFRAASRGRHAIAILAWVTFAKRPLSLRELETAVAVMLTNSGNWADYLEDRIFLDADLIKERLGTLIDVIDGELFVIHQSLLDFLKTRPTIWHEGDLELQLPRPNLALGRTCMRYLSFGDINIRKDKISVEEDCSDKEEATFLGYAATYWYEHIESIDDVKDSIDLVQSIFMGSNHEHWRRAHETKLWYRNSSIFDICVYFDIGWLASGLKDPSVPELSHQFTEESLVQIAVYAPKVLSHVLQNDIMPEFQITPKVVTAAARSPYGTLKLLLEKRGDEIPITPELITTVAGKTVEVLEFLLEKRGNEFQITPEVVAATATGSSSENLKLLLEKRGDEFQITPEAVAAAAGRSPENLKLLLEKRGDEIRITPEVVTAAVNGFRAKETVELLLDERGNEIQSTPEVLIAAAGDQNGMKLLEFLLEKRGDEIQITPEVLTAAAWRSPENLKLLLEKRGDEIQITPEVVTAAAVAAWGSSENLKLLLEKRGDEILITPKVVTVTAAWGPSESLKLLLDKGGDEIQITPEVVVAAAVAAWGSSEKLKVLREKSGDGRLTYEPFMAATEAYGSSEDLKLLLEKRVDDLPITPEENTIAALRSSWNLKLLLEERGDEIRAMLISSDLYRGEKIQEMERDDLLELCRIAVERSDQC